jgi:methanogenic corrinoid protein MtbC1
MEQPSIWTQRVLAAIDRHDPLSCTSALQAAEADLPAAVLVSQVIAPCLYEAGVRWNSGQYSIVQEHMLSSAVLRHLAAALDRSNRPDARHAVAFVTLSGDRHGVGALMAAVVAARHGVRALHLGWDLPVEQLGLLARRTPLAAVALSIVARPTAVDAEGQLHALRAALPAGVEIWVGGYGSKHMSAEALPPSTCLMSTIDAYTARLDALVGAAGAKDSP